MLKDPDEQFENIVTVIKTLILRGGIWEDANRFYFWSMRFAQMCFVLTLATQVIGLYTAIGDIEKMFECFSVLTFCNMGYLKLRCLVANKPRWIYLLSQASQMEHDQVNNMPLNDEYDSDNDGSPSNSFHTQIKTYTDQFRSMANILSKIYYSTLLIFILSPFIEYGYRLFKGRKVGWPHVLPGWAPLDSFSIYGYLVTIIAEIIAAVYCVVVHMSFDSTVFGMMIFISGQFSLLKNYSEHICGRGKDLFLSPARDARAHYRIVKCHRILISLDDSVAELDTLVQNILGIYFFVVTLTLCTVAVRLSSNELTVMQVISLVQYTGASLIQLFLFCYYGDMVLHKSTIGTGQGPFAAGYWCLSPRVRRELLLLAVGMARVRRLHAGPFNSLDLPAFNQIVRTAYSYYAILRKQKIK